jgi:hypothetical protein
MVQSLLRMGVNEDFTGRVSVSADAEIGDTRGGSGHGVPCPYGERERARILRRERRICIVLEMRHLLGTMVEKEERLLLE